MILESIQLYQVGPFSKAVKVGKLGPGSNILSAANEAGKSTLVKAATRALFDRHTCKDQEIKALQPAGSETSPTMAIVFQAAGERYKLDKNFLLSPRCQLSHWRGDAWQVVAEADEADKRLTALLQFNFPARGASKEAHWGMMRYLWSRQGDPADWPEWNDDAGRNIKDRLVERSAGAKIEIDPLTGQLCKTLMGEYLTLFTATGQPKAGGELKKAEDELAALDLQLAALKKRREELETLQTQHTRLGEELAKLDAESAQKTKESESIRALAAAAAVQSETLRAQEEAFNAAHAALGAITQDGDAEARRKVDADQARSKRATLQTAVQSGREAEAALLKRYIAAEKAHEQAQEELKSSQDDYNRTKDLLKHRQVAREADDLATLSKKVAEERKRKKALEVELAGLPALNATKLKNLVRLQQEIQTREAQLEPQGLSIELLPERAAEVEVSPPTPVKSVSLNAKKPTVLHAAQRMELKLKGWGVISIRSGAEQLKTLLAALEADKKKLADALRELDLDSVDAGATVLSKREELQKQLDKSEAAVAGLLLNRNLKDDPDREHAAIKARLAKLEMWTNPTDAERRMALAEVEALEDRLEIQTRSLEKDFQKRVAALKAAGKEREDARAAAAESEKQLALLSQTLQALEQQSAELSKRYPRGIDGAKSEAQEKFMTAEARLKDARAQMPADYERLPERNRRLAKAAEEAADELKRKREDFIRVDATLRDRGSEGLYSKETELLERRTIVLHDIESARARGWAARLVHDLIAHRKQAATRAVLSPLEDRLSSVFAEITGNANRRVFMDEHLQIDGVGRTRAERVAFNALSQGAREQLLLALRLAVGAALSVDEPQLLVLDDVLVNTDALRQDRILDLLRAQERMQILILTCHPERYRGVGVSLQIENDETVVADNLFHAETE